MPGRNDRHLPGIQFIDIGQSPRTTLTATVQVFNCPKGLIPRDCLAGQIGFLQPTEIGQAVNDAFAGEDKSWFGTGVPETEFPVLSATGAEDLFSGRVMTGDLVGLEKAYGGHGRIKG